MAKFIPNWNSHHWVSQQTELTQSKTPPTAVTDSIILSKGTWSVNRRATNIISRNEAERLSLKSNISIAKQCFLLSKQLANNGKPSFMLSFHEIMKLYCNTSTNKLQFSSILVQEPKLVNSRLPKIKQAIIDYFKKDQTNMLRSYKKLNFYSTFKNNVSRSEYLDLIKSEKTKQKKKLRSSNHRLELKLLLPSS